MGFVAGALLIPWAAPVGSARAMDSVPRNAASPVVTGDTTRICLAPATVEANAGGVDKIVDAVREAFTSFLTGPSLQARPLTARLQSQAREEAKGANCQYLLLTTVKHVRQSGGQSLIGKMAGGAVQAGVASAGGAVGSTAGRIAANAAAGATNAAVYGFAGSVRTKDELTLSYRLESAGGKSLLDKTEKRKAKSDGEDLLTPLVQNSSEAIASVVAKPSR
jgi:hypothetical protein